MDAITTREVGEGGTRKVDYGRVKGEIFDLIDVPDWSRQGRKVDPSCLNRCPDGTDSSTERAAGDPVAKVLAPGGYQRNDEISSACKEA